MKTKHRWMIRWTLALSTLVAVATGAVVLLPPLLASLDSHANASETDATHDAHERDVEHEDHDDEALLELTATDLEELDISLRQASPGPILVNVALPGEVRLNEDRLAHVVPKLAGIVREVNVSLGDHVRPGEVMAVLESRELAEAKSSYMAAKERESLAATIYEREKNLWEDQISAEQEYLEAKNALAETRIEVRAATQELTALGISETDIATIAGEPSASWTRYVVTAPFEGTVIAKHITLGEYVEVNADVFTVADLRTVWIDLSVYPKDLNHVREGQYVRITAQTNLPDAEGAISYVGPLVGEATRTALARVVLPNPEGTWKPGMFVSGAVVVEQQDASLVVPKTALLTIDDRPHVFVKDAHGFEPVAINIGRQDESNVEVLSGLSEGQTYVASGGFHLKAELGKEAFAHSGHNH